MTEFLYKYDSKSGNSNLSIIADNPELAEREHLGLMKSAIEDRLDGDLSSSEMHTVFQAEPSDMPIAETAKIVSSGDVDMIVDTNGIFNITNGVDFFPLVSTGMNVVEHLEDDAPAIALARQLGCNACAWQTELMLDPARAPYFASSEQYLSLGNTDTIGNYTPCVTVLPESHPIRQLSAAAINATQK